MNLNEIEKYIQFNYKPIKEKWRGIVIHHSDTMDGDKKDWEAIRRYHVYNNHWKDIGYHFGVENISKKLEYQIGRPLHWNGAHCIGFNQNFLGICLVGDYDNISPSQDQYDYIKGLILLIKKYFLIRDILLHREAIEIYRNEPIKTCPGIKFDKNKIL